MLALGTVVLASMALLFALDSWYKDFGPTYERLQGRWICDSTFRYEGNSMIIEGCRIHNSNGSNSWYYLDWTEDGEVVGNLDANKIGTGTYKFVYPWTIGNHGAAMEIEMNFPTALANGFTLTSGNYM